MRILAFSDLHLDVAARDAILAAAGEADLLIGAGDFANRHEGLADYIAPFEAVADKTVFTCGNNETFAALRESTSVPVLHGTTIERGGLVIAGIGCGIPPLTDAPFVSFDMEEDDAEAMLSEIDAADILISHSPPKGIGDAHSSAGSIGSIAVAEAAARIAPRFLFCGHVHDCWGVRGTIGTTEVANLGPGLNWFETQD
ncbi:metallophosphoesterase family protein [Pelagovum pacificum]|uniref:Serine/threonine protein phosphatase n=1 Tax=Pelagovum pacificum TaxID=2588711 RepID=A0A5C5GIC2_9RHOB|nr:metallophosphoesterase family protein [Pelagovum pacificum]QQA43229.1 metallophosphoesterase family protein [Pelagovum pacificum]TNY33631.1 serine/threonine protein phosphatase [Pelagovum pacificum]